MTILLTEEQKVHVWKISNKTKPQVLVINNKKNKNKNNTDWESKTFWSLSSKLVTSEKNSKTKNHQISFCFSGRKQTQLN